MASSILTEDTSEMVRSKTHDFNGTAPPGPPTTWMMGNIPATDKDFPEWREDQPLLTHDLEVQQAMMVYVKWLNLKGRETYEQQKKVYEAYLLSAKPVDAVPAA